jgi:hypothetical protein
MKQRSILIVGKKGILHWQEDLEEAFLELGCRCEIFYVNPVSCKEWIDKKRVGETPFMSDAFKERFRNTVLRCRPQLIFFLNMFILSQNFSEFINQFAPNRSLVTAGWMADCVNRIPDINYSTFDRLYYFDSHMKPFLEKFYRDDTNISFLPLAVNEKKYFDQKKERNDRLLFAGTCSKERLRMFHEIKKEVPLDVIGPHCRSILGMNLGKRLSTIRLNNLYNTYEICLNINQKPNTINGLNFRPFEATAAKSLVINENVPDLPDIFDLEKEIVTYGTTEELIEKYNTLSKDAFQRTKIAEAGYRRTLSQHTFSHRAEYILKDLGI